MWLWILLAVYASGFATFAAFFLLLLAETGIRGFIVSTRMAAQWPLLLIERWANRKERGM